MISLGKQSACRSGETSLPKQDICSEVRSAARSGTVGLSIIVPAFNEELNIRAAVENIVDGLPSGVREYELIIVDDGSTDATCDIICGLAADNKRIKPVCHGRNRGKGAALRSGFALATMEWVFFTDADLQIDACELASFLPYAGEYDLVIGYRDARGDSALRRILSRGYALLVALLLGVRVRDLNCPFKMFRKDRVRELELGSQGFLIDTELLFKASRYGWKLKELPVKGHARSMGRSTVKVRHVGKAATELVAMAVTLRWPFFGRGGRK